MRKENLYNLNLFFLFKTLIIERKLKQTTKVDTQRLIRNAVLIRNIVGCAFKACKFVLKTNF